MQTAPQQPDQHNAALRDVELRPIRGGFAAKRAGGKGQAQHNPAQSAPYNSATSGLLHATTKMQQPRQGSIHQAAHEPAHQHGMLQVSTRTLATIGIGAAGATFVLVAFIGSVMGVRSGPAEEVNTAVASINQPVVQHTWSGNQADTSISVNEYGRQVAVATLTSQLHEVTNTSVTFYGDPKKSGNALQQFAEVFGDAIATGRNPSPQPSPTLR